MDDKHKAFSNLFFSGIGFLVSMAVGLLLPRFFALTYGSVVNGLINSVNQFIVYLNLFEAGIGAATLQALYGAFAVSDQSSVSSIMKASGEYYRKSGLYYLLGLFSLCILYPLLFSTELPYWEVFGIIFFMGIPNVMNFWLQGKYVIMLEAEGKKYIPTNINTIVKVLTCFAKIILIYMRMNVLLIMAVSFLVNIISMIYVVVYVKRHYKWLDPHAKADYKSISQKSFAIIHEISGLVFANTDIIILTSVCGLKVVSVYSMYKLVTCQLYTMINIFPDSLAFSLGKCYQTDKERFKTILDIVESGHSVIYHSVYAVTLYLFIPFMKLYTAGITDIDYLDYRIAILFVSIELLGFCRTLSITTINRFAGHFRLTTSRTVIESVINLTVSLVGVRFLGIYGVLLGTIIALLYRSNDCILYMNHRLLERSAIKTYSIHLSSFIGFLLLQFIFRLFVKEIDSYYVFVCYGAGMLAISFVVILLIQMILFKNFRKAVLSIFVKGSSFKGIISEKQ